ncbi:hypothetical protein NWP96_07980 [Mycoplasmopsis cynos]|nr:hypothetical protein [Mycoplasmopsis cynos]
MSLCMIKNNIDTLEYLEQQKEQEMKAEELKDEILQKYQETQNTEFKQKKKLTNYKIQQMQK